MVYRVLAAFSVMLGGYLNSIVALLCGAYFMLRFTRKLKADIWQKPLTVPSNSGEQEVRLLYILRVHEDKGSKNVRIVPLVLFIAIHKIIVISGSQIYETILGNLPA